MRELARAWVAWLLLTLSILWVFSITLGPQSSLSGDVSLIPFNEKWAMLRCVLRDCPAERGALRSLVVDGIGNVIAFIPFGAAFAFAYPARVPSLARVHRRRYWWLTVAGAGLLLSGLVELTQLFLPSRFTDVDDLVLNTLGALIGAALVRWIGMSRYPAMTHEGNR